MAGQKPFYFLLGAVVVAGAAMIGLKARGGAPVSIPVNPVITTANTSGFRGYLVGNDDAPLEITEYGDFQCPACGSFAVMQYPDVEKRLIQTGKVRFRFRDFPLDGVHSHPREAAHAAACADVQGAYWPMAHAIFASQASWAIQSNPIPAFRKLAEALGINGDQWSDCMKAGTFAGRIQASLLEGAALGVSSTPSFLIDGRIYGGMSSDQMVSLVDSILAARSDSSTR